MAFKFPEFITNIVNKYKTAQQQIVNTIGSDTPKGILRRIKGIVGNLNIFSKKWAKKNIPEEYKKGVNHVVDSLKEQGVTAKGFDAFVDNHKRAIDISVKNTTNQLVQANEYVGRKIQDVIRQVGVDATSRKIDQKMTVDEIKKEIKDGLINAGITGVKTSNGRVIRLDSYAELVARSTSREATNRGVMTQMQALGLDLVKMSSHATTCKLCGIMQGRVYSISGKDDRFPPLNKAYKGIYANIHPNCFVGDTLVTSPPIYATSSREYCGEVVEIITSSGNKVVVTPNHPILTPEGWVSAGLIIEGQKVVENRFSDKPTTLGIDPNNINIKTRIEDVVHSFEKTFPMSTISVKVSPEDFHGDGVNSKICIINSNSFLRDEINAMASKYFGKSLFMNASNGSFFLNTKSFFNKSFVRLFTAFERIISGFSKFGTLFGSHSFEPCCHRFAPVNGFGKTVFSESERYNRFINPKRIGYRFLGFPISVSAYNLVNNISKFIRLRFIDSLSKFRKVKTFLSHSYFESSLADIDNGRYLLDCISDQVQFTDVIKINKKFFHGKVFNLHTKNNWYVANNIITHNCRHVLTPYVEKLKSKEELEKDMEFSNRSFDVDARTKQQIDDYNKEQANKADLNTDRHQFERYRVALGDKAPKSLAGFRRMKKANSEKYQEVVSEYKKIRGKGRNSNGVQI